MRRVSKLTAERLLASPPARHLARRVRRGRCLILAYHNITAGRVEAGDRSLHLRFDEFRRQLDELSAVQVLSLHQALGSSGEDPPAVVLTFDDAYAGAVTWALPELLARGYPATVFVAPGILGRAAMWWDLLAGSTGGVGTELRQRCLDELAGDHGVIMATASRLGWPVGEIREHFRIASEKELDAALIGDGITLGVHSWSHANLAATSGTALEEELVRPLEWLQARWPRHTFPWLAFPYGIPISEPSPLPQSGLGPGLLASGGWLTPAMGTDRPLPRVTVPAGLSLAGFRARTMGLWPCR